MAEPTNTPYPPATPVTTLTPLSTAPTSRASTPPDAPGYFQSTVASSDARPGASSATKPIVLHIGDPVKYNPETYAVFAEHYNVVRPSASERQRDEFKRALIEKRWGNFQAIFRPFWGTGGEMGLWDEELISLLPSTVKVFASAGAGFDWADVKLLGQRGITYCNSGLAAADSVADFALALIISTFRHLPWCISAAVGPGEAFQDCHARATAVSHTLSTQTLGLIGLGNIGIAIANRARFGFGMSIHYHDIFRRPADDENKLDATFHDSLESLVRTVDCVVLCVPSSGNRLINATTLGYFKQGSRFVNIARGSLVDEEALADALEAGVLSSIALDVHDSEPQVHPRLKSFAGTKALLTCHNAGGTVETHIGFEELSMRNIMAVLGGKEALTPVNREHLRA